jgi:hypothetical protein
MNYDRLASDIAEGKGVYLESLYELYYAKTLKQKQNVYYLAKVAHSNSVSIPDFASALVSKL